LAGAGGGDDDVGKGKAGEAGEELGLVFEGEEGGDGHSQDDQKRDFHVNILACLTCGWCLQLGFWLGE